MFRGGSCQPDVDAAIAALTRRHEVRQTSLADRLLQAPPEQSLLVRSQHDVMQNFYNNYREDTSKDENGVVDGDPAAKSAEGKGKAGTVPDAAADSDTTYSGDDDIAQDGGDDGTEGGK